MRFIMSPKSPEQHRESRARTRQRPPAESGDHAKWRHKDLLSLERVSGREIRRLLNRASSYADQVITRGRQRGKELAGYTIANLFFEDSTRTRTSFAQAARALGASVLDLSTRGSSTSKGETTIDTARNIEAMGVHALIIRHSSSGAVEMVAQRVSCGVINAGDGRHEHPTQGLLDALTLARLWNGPGGGYEMDNRCVAIVGDVANSRVARSNVHGLTKLGARVVLVGPPSLCPKGLKSLADHVEVTDDLDATIGSVDAIMMLRIQFERLNGQVFPSVREYRAGYALTADRAMRMKPAAVVMHPGPINRGLEMDAEVADGRRSVIMNQVTHGVAVRMAVLEACILRDGSGAI